MKPVTLLQILAVTAVAVVVVIVTRQPSGRAQEGAAPQDAAASPAAARSAREVRGPTPYLPANEPPPELIVDEPHR